jgi:hypothetical protein
MINDKSYFEECAPMQDSSKWVHYSCPQCPESEDDQEFESVLQQVS